MNYKKINDIMIKDYYKDKNVRIGKMGDKYIVVPEGAFFVVVPEKEMICDPIKIKGDSHWFLINNMVDDIESKKYYEAATATGNAIKTSLDYTAIELRDKKGLHSRYVDEKLLKLFGKDIKILIHSDEKYPIAIWDEEEKELLGAICPIKK